MTLTQTNDIAYQIVETASLSADDRQGKDILVLGVGEVSVLADFFLIVTAQSKAQARAIGKQIQDQVWAKHQRQPLRTSGELEASWIVLDYGEVIVHIMQAQEREFYALEAFWGHAPRLSLVKTA
jgi:ribosome-associated protein